MSNNYTYTNTFTYTKPRVNVLGDQFEMFFTVAGMSESKIEMHMKSIERHELQAVGVYLEENGHRIAEVELRVDWKQHVDFISITGSLFDTDLPGWKNGTAPEAHIPVRKLSMEAKRLGLQVRYWISVSNQVYNDSSTHKQVCERLGYEFGSTVPPWAPGMSPLEQKRKILGLEEAEVTVRMARANS